MAQTSIKKKLSKDMATARSLSTPTRGNKYAAVFSRRPRPPIEIGNIVIAPMIGKNIKK